MLIFLILAVIILLCLPGDCYSCSSFTVVGNARYADCPPGYINNGEYCASNGYRVAALGERVASCPSDYTFVNDQCVRASDLITPSSRLAECPSGYVRDGNLCKRDFLIKNNQNFRNADCPAGYTKLGDSICKQPDNIIDNTNIKPASLVCEYDSVYDPIVQKCIFPERKSTPRCPADGTLSTWTDGTLVCDKIGTCDAATEEKLAGNVCYTKCPDGTTRSPYDLTKCLLSSNVAFPIGVRCDSTDYPHLIEAKKREDSLCYGLCPDLEYKQTEYKTTCIKPGAEFNSSVMKCNPDEYLYDNTCYKQCSTGSVNFGPMCITLSDTLDSNSMLCKNDEFLYNGKCYKSCPSGYLQGAGVCYRPQSVKGSSGMQCDADEVLFGNKCYKKCTNGNVQNGNMCVLTTKDPKMSCKPGEKLDGVYCISNPY